MHISKLYNTNLDIIIRGITNNPKGIKKNYIFVNTDNNHIEAIKNGANIIVTKAKILNPNLIVFNTNNIQKEYLRLLKLFYHYNENRNSIGIDYLNDYNTSLYLSTVLSSPTITSSNINKVFNNLSNLSKDNVALLDINLDYDFKALIILSSLKSNYKYLIQKVRLLSKNSLLIINAEDKGLSNLKYYTKCRVITFGFSKGDYKITNYILNLEGAFFTIDYKNTVLGEFKIKSFNISSILEATASIIYANEIGISYNSIKNKLIQLSFSPSISYINNKCIISENTDNSFILSNFIKSISYIHQGGVIAILYINESLLNKKIIHDLNIYVDEIILIYNFYSPKILSILKLLIKDYYLCLSLDDAIKLADRISYKTDYIIINKKISLNKIKEALNT